MLTIKHFLEGKGAYFPGKGHRSVIGKQEREEGRKGGRKEGKGKRGKVGVEGVRGGGGGVERGERGGGGRKDLSGLELGL